jgi:hypothetical protein
MLAATVFTITKEFSMLPLKTDILMCVVDLFNDYVTPMEKTGNHNFKESGT